MGREISEVKSYLQELITKVDKLALAQTEVSDLRREVVELKNELAALKNTNDAQSTLKWVILVASVIINIVLVYQLFGG